MIFQNKLLETTHMQVNKRCFHENSFMGGDLVAIPNDVIKRQLSPYYWSFFKGIRRPIVESLLNRQ